MFKPTKEQLKVSSEIGLKYDLKLIVIFGSVVKGTTHSQSDTDIAVLGKQKLDLNETLEISGMFDKVFKESQIIDLFPQGVVLNAVVGRDGVLLFESTNSFFTEFKIRAWSNFIDYEEIFKIQRKLISEKIQSL